MCETYYTQTRQTGELRRRAWPEKGATMRITEKNKLTGIQNNNFD